MATDRVIDSVPADAIRVAATPADFAAFAGLVSEYVDWCRARYQDLGGFVEQVFGHQSLASELRELSTKYAPPLGKTLIAERDGRICGAVAYRRLADGSCEMKRLFVPEREQGRGLGRRLCSAILAAARADGFALMRLDTGDRFTEAIAMYTALGFTRCAPHLEYPPQLLAHLVFMQAELPRA